MVLMNGTAVKATLVGVVGAALLVTGCSSSQKPATLGTTGAAGGTAAVGGVSGGTPSGGATGTATPSAGATGSTAPGAAGGVSGGASSSAAGGALGANPTDPNAAAALTAYKGFRTLEIQMEDSATFSSKAIDYADSDALDQLNSGITQLRGNNIHFVGSPTYTSAVTAIDMAAKPMPSVTIVECSNRTKWALVFSSGPKKGQNAQTTPPKSAYPVTYKVHKGADGHWRVYSVVAKQDQTC
jgi:ketosteroid isomerase-like protein